MTRREIDRLQRRIEAIRGQYKAGISTIFPDENGGYFLSCTAPGARLGDVLEEKSHHDTIEAAEAAHSLFLQAHPPERGDEPPLIIWDI